MLVHPRGREAARHSGGRSGAPGPCARLGAPARRSARGPAAGRVGGREHLAERRVRGGRRDQRPDQRRGRAPNGGAVFHDTAVWLRKEPVAMKVPAAAAGSCRHDRPVQRHAHYADARDASGDGGGRGRRRADVPRPDRESIMRAGRGAAGQGSRGLSAVRNDVQPDRGAGAPPPGRRGDPGGERASVSCRIGRSGGARGRHDAPDPGRARHVHCRSGACGDPAASFQACPALASSGSREHEQSRRRRGGRSRRSTR